MTAPRSAAASQPSTATCSSEQVRTRAARSALLVDAKDAAARAFYAKFGFHSLADDPQHLFIMRATIEPLLGRV